jgi:hypothetical protein
MSGRRGPRVNQALRAQEERAGSADSQDYLGQPVLRAPEVMSERRGPKVSQALWAQEERPGSADSRDHPGHPGLWVHEVTLGCRAPRVNQAFLVSGERSASADHLDHLVLRVSKAKLDHRDPKASPIIEALRCAFCAGGNQAPVVRTSC